MAFMLQVSKNKNSLPKSRMDRVTNWLGLGNGCHPILEHVQHFGNKEISYIDMLEVFSQNKSREKNERKK